MNFAPAEFLDFDQTAHRELFEGVEQVWQAIPQISSYLEKILGENSHPGIQGSVSDSAHIGNDVFIGTGTVVEANAVIKGPAWIGSNVTIRSGAYLREKVIVGDDCTLGNSSEFKNCILFNGCEVPHFNYVGDSILGYKAHLGAGVICSNVRLDRLGVKVRPPGEPMIDSGLRKFGAIIGDHTEIGCNSVLSPGSVIGSNCIIYPLTGWTGVLAHRSIVKNQPSLKIVERK